MRNFCLALLATLAFTVSAFAEPAIRTKDPEKFIIDLFGTPPKINSADIAKAIGTAIGKPTAVEPVAKALQIFDGKKVEVFKKVVDNDFGGVLRQIIYYAWVEDTAFVYFRFNYKLTGTGWLLSNFTFKTESEELFPKDFITH